MQLDGGKDAFQHRGAQVGTVQNVQAGVGGGGVHQGPAHFAGSAAQRRVGAEHLGAAIGGVGMGVHDARCQLDQLAHMAYEKRFFKVCRCGHIQRVTDEVRGLDHREPLELRQGAGQIVQPVVARGQHQPPWAVCVFGTQSGLIHFQLDGVQNGLLAHGLHDTAGAQHGKPALHPDVGVEGALCRFGPALNGDGHGKAACVGRVLGLPFQRFGDHLAGYMVDGGFAHRLVKAGLRHPAHTLAAKDAHAGRVRFQHDRCNDRQAGGHIYIVAAVLANGTFCAGVRFAAEDGCHLHHNALRGAQGHRLRCMAGEQQSCRARRTQGRTGAGGVTAAQQLLPAADVMLKLRPSRVGFRLWRLRCAV